MELPSLHKRRSRSVLTHAPGAIGTTVGSLKYDYRGSAYAFSRVLVSTAQLHRRKHPPPPRRPPPPGAGAAHPSIASTIASHLHCHLSSCAHRSHARSGFALLLLPRGTRRDLEHGSQTSRPHSRQWWRRLKSGWKALSHSVQAVASLSRCHATPYLWGGEAP